MCRAFFILEKQNCCGLIRNLPFKTYFCKEVTLTLELKWLSRNMETTVIAGIGWFPVCDTLITCVYHDIEDSAFGIVFADILVWTEGTSISTRERNNFYQSPPFAKPLPSCSNGPCRSQFLESLVCCRGEEGSMNILLLMPEILRIQPTAFYNVLFLKKKTYGMLNTSRRTITTK